MQRTIWCFCATPGGNTTSRSHAPQLLQFTTPLTIHDGRLDHVAGQATLLQKLAARRTPRGLLEIAERLGRGQARPVEKRVAGHQIAVHVKQLLLVDRNRRNAEYRHFARHRSARTDEKVAVRGDLRDVERAGDDADPLEAGLTVVLRLLAVTGQERYAGFVLQAKQQIVEKADGAVIVLRRPRFRAHVNGAPELAVARFVRLTQHRVQAVKIDAFLYPGIAQHLARRGILSAQVLRRQALRNQNRGCGEKGRNIAQGVFIVVHIDGAHAEEPRDDGRMKRTLRNRHIYLFVLQEIPQLAYAHRVAVSLGEASGAVVLPDHRVLDPVELEQLNRVRQRSRRHDELMRTGEILEHPGEHVDVRGVGDFKPDIHASPLASGFHEHGNKPTLDMCYKSELNNSSGGPDLLRLRSPNLSAHPQFVARQLHLHGEAYCLLPATGPPEPES